jgi:hypothetical protein
MDAVGKISGALLFRDETAERYNAQLHVIWLTAVHDECQGICHASGTGVIGECPR